MRVNIGPYKKWNGPYQLAELICFWARRTKDEYGFFDKPDYVHNFGEWLAHGSIEPEAAVGEIRSLGGDERPKTLLYKFLLWVDSKKERKVDVSIDKWDTVSLDTTLAYVILPGLKEIKKNKNGSPCVSDEDVPENLRVPSLNDEFDENTYKNLEDRWAYVLDEMIFAFESVIDTSWEDQFYSSNFSGSTGFEKMENGNYRMVGLADSKVDSEGIKKYQKRIQNGLVLFGKYYQSLWT
jgi:hypothetical protein